MARSLSQSPAASTHDAHHRHLRTMLDICRAIGSILDPDTLIDQVMEQVTAAFDADRSTLFLHDPKNRRLWSKIAQGIDNTSRQIRIDDTHGLAGHVFQSRRSLRIEDTFAEPRFNAAAAKATGYVPRSMLIAPVSHQADHYDGVIQVMHAQVGYFTQSDLTLLEAIAVQIGVSLDNARLYAAQRRQFHSFVEAFTYAIDARDTTTAIHSINVANYAQGIGHYLGLPPEELEWLRVAGLLHDVGKIGTPEHILCKDGKLTDDEFVEMKRHAAYSKKILSRIEFMDEYHDIDRIASAHHEKLDGSGYPDGLTADQIPLKARILAVADIYHALTQDRQYRKGMAHAKAMSILESMTPHQLDAGCLAALKEFVGEEPGVALRSTPA